MTADPENREPREEALDWGNGNDPTHVDGPVDSPVATKPGRETAETTATEPAAKPATSSALLITYGVLAGIYLIYTLGWFIAVQRLNATRASSSELLSEIMFQFGEFLAIASPIIWFAAIFLLTRGEKPLVRLLWLLAGVVAVLPWPFVLGAWL
jgi:hypothetical protein